MTTIIRAMTVEDYDQLHALWMRIKGFGIRSIDDSKEGVERFLKRNPTTSVIAEIDGKSSRRNPLRTRRKNRMFFIMYV